VQMGVKQRLAPQKLVGDADGLRHLAGAHQRAEVALGIVQIAGRLRSREYGLRATEACDMVASPIWVERT
jgi:hypothetical protein